MSTLIYTFLLNFQFLLILNNQKGQEESMSLLKKWLLFLMFHSLFGDIDEGCFFFFFIVVVVLFVEISLERKKEREKERKKKNLIFSKF